METGAKGHSQDKQEPDVPVDQDLFDRLQWLASTPHAMLSRPRPALLGLMKHDGENIPIWLVDGQVVRAEHDMDFNQAGNGMEDPELCGKNEIVLDDCILPKEWPFDVYHEMTEMAEMRKGKTYDQGHKVANDQERTLRRKALKDG